MKFLKAVIKFDLCPTAAARFWSSTPPGNHVAEMRNMVAAVIGFTTFPFEAKVLSGYADAE